MNKRFWIWTFLVLGLATAAFALEPVDTPPFQSSIPKPVPLAPKEKIKDSARYRLPDPPSKNSDGTPLKVENERESLPEGPALRDLTDPSALQEIPKIDKKDRKRGKYYWLPYKGWNYCHLRQASGQWYGWRTGGTFHWVLWKFGHFWWRDDAAQRWLYFDRGYWRWQAASAKAPSGRFEAMLPDEHYYACGLDGTLGADLGRTGKGETEPDPSVP